MREDELLAALLHELSGPISAVYYDLERMRVNVHRFIRRRRVFDVVCAVLSGERGSLPPFRRRTISKAIATLDLSRPIASEVEPSLAVRAASGALASVLQNLVTNAQRHALGSTVTIRAYQLAQGATPWPSDSPVTLQGPVVVVEVADTGKGIPASLRPQLFELGAQARPGGSGSGVGLWLSRLVVRAHGGELWLADSTRGALFVSVWPMAPVPERPVPMEQASTFSVRPRRDGWPSDPAEFGKAVREAREEAQLTRKEFASLAHIAEATLRNLETGRHECTLSIRRKVVEHFARLHIAPPAPVAAPEAPSGRL